MKKLKGWILLFLGLGLAVLGLVTSGYWKLTKLLNSSYLILLQNNTELRPTGGFIGSYALVSLKNGAMGNVQVNDIYEADGQIKGHIEPPEPIQEAFGLGEWRLRDANWEADFNESAQKLKWFFDKAGIRNWEVMAAANLSVFEELVSLLGKVELTDYGEVITTENLWAKTQYYAQDNFFPGSKQKREFLSDLAFAVRKKLSIADMVTKIKFVKLLNKMLVEKQIMLWAKDEDLESVFDNLGWSGRLRSAKCPWISQRLTGAQNCISESLVINEANLGVNKANCCIERQVKLVVSREDGLIRHDLEIKFKNNSNNEWGGKYQAWVRVYAPDPENVQGFWVEVPVGEEKVYNVQYELLVEKSQKRPIYLLIQKQSGVKSIPMEIVYGDDNKVMKKNIDLVGDKTVRLGN